MSQTITDVEAGLRSLDDHCLSGLVAGLQAMQEGDLTVAVMPVTQPIDPNRAHGSEVGLVELFNAMLALARQALAGYEAVREQQRAALGDQSCLEQLESRLNSLSDHCLAALGEGLGAMTRGDLTVAAEPVTTPIETAPGADAGRLAGTFNTMLGRAQAGLSSYNEMRGQVGTMIRDISSTASQLSAASQQMSATTQQTRESIVEIARATTDIAAGVHVAVVQRRRGERVHRARVHVHERGLGGGHGHERHDRAGVGVGPAVERGDR